MAFTIGAQYLLERAIMKQKHFDEELSEILWHCYQLKQKAKAMQEDKSSLPAWLVKLLRDKPKA
ncbi:MAG: hypothetical protein DI539_20405 [Flavobacterium psychrophilum]|nr:MAG: hypothetical protein DI539_20405 [Flavobacterium psychrophilum]